MMIALWRATQWVDRLLCRLHGHGGLVLDHDDGVPVWRCMACFACWPYQGRPR